MNKFAIAVLAASLSTLSAPLFAADNNAQQNAAADAGMEAPGSHQQMAPKGVDNSDINNTSTNTNSQMGTGHTPTTGNGTNTNKIDNDALCNGDQCAKHHHKKHSATPSTGTSQ